MNYKFSDNNNSEKNVIVIDKANNEKITKKVKM